MFFPPSQSKSVSSTDSQRAEEKQGPSGGEYGGEGSREGKRRRCEDKDPQHYVRTHWGLHCLQSSWS